MWRRVKKKVKSFCTKIVKLSGYHPNAIQLYDEHNKYDTNCVSLLSYWSKPDLELQIDGNWISKSLIDATFAEDSIHKLLKICRQEEVYRLEDIITKEIHERMEVLSSGCYSEVLTVKSVSGEDIVLKISLINRVNKKGIVIQNCSSILSDVINSKRLSDLKTIPSDSTNYYCENFANITNYYYARSHRLIFNKSEIKSKDAKNKNYEYFISQQTYGGIELDSVSGLSPTKGLSIALQLIAAIAVAEEAMEFEHRDLHCSNLLIKRCPHNYLYYVINGHKFAIKLNGIKAVIIDTTFSRTQMKIAVNSEKEVLECYYNDLSSLNLEDYPNCELKKVYLRQNQITSNDWKKFWPKTNIIWLSYCIKSILHKVDKYCAKHSIGTNSSLQTSDSQHYSKLKQINDTINDSESVKSFAQFCKMFD